MWFKVAASDSAFADRSQQHFTYDFRVEATTTKVFELVTDPAELGGWMPDLRAARWVTDLPHGVGSVREVRLKNVAVHEKVLIWEPGERFVFTIVRASVPLLKHMLEDYRFDALAGGATRVRWTIAYQPHLMARPLEALLAPGFSRLLEAACQRLVHLGRAPQPPKTSA